MTRMSHFVALRRMIAVWRCHLDDMAEGVVGPRVGRAFFITGLTAGVVSQHHIDRDWITYVAGRSIGVASRRSAARRVSISISA